MKKGFLLSSFLMIALCLSAIVGSTFALFTSESTTNIAVTSGKVEVEASVQDIVLYSMGEQQSGSFENGGTVSIDGGLLTLSNITPGDKVTFAVKVNNKSNVRTMWRFVWECTEGTPLMSYMNVTIDNLEAGAIKSHRSAWEILDVAGDTVNVSMELPVNVGNEAQGLTTKVLFRVEAVQANGAEVDAKYTEAAETVYIEGYSSEKVEVVGSEVAEEVEISSNGYEAIVPAGTTLEAGAENVSLNVESAEAYTGNFTFNVNGVETIGLNISIPEVADNNTTPIIIKLEKAVEALAADETLFMYHKGVQMIQVASEAEVNEAHEFYHDEATGDIVFATVNFSNFTIAKAKQVKVSTKAELEAAVAKGPSVVVLANDIELSKTLAIKRDVIIDLNGYAISAGFTSSKLIQVYSDQKANLVITSSKEGAELNVFGNALILNYGTVEFSNVAINVAEIKSSSYTTFQTYGNVKLGKGVVVNVEYLGTSLISANGACEVVMDGATINVGTFKVNWSAFISKANATVLNINQADINIESLGNETYPVYSYFTSDNLNVTINECNFDAKYDGVKYVAVDKDGKYKWVKAVSTVEELQAAIEAEEEIILANDIEVPANVARGFTVAKGKKAVIDLNGHDIYCDSEINEHIELFYVEGELVIKGKGTISLTNPNFAWTTSYRHTAINIRETGVVTLEEGVKVVCTAGEKTEGGYAMAYAVDIYTTGVLNVNGAELHSNYIAVRCFFGDGVVNVNAGKITSSRNNYGIWLQSSPNAKVTIAEGIEYEINDSMIYIFK